MGEQAPGWERGTGPAERPVGPDPSLLKESGFKMPFPSGKHPSSSRNRDRSIPFEEAQDPIGAYLRINVRSLIRPASSPARQPARTASTSRVTPSMALLFPPSRAMARERPVPARHPPEPPACRIVGRSGRNDSVTLVSRSKAQSIHQQANHPARMLGVTSVPGTA